MAQKRNFAEYAARFICLLLGLFILAQGIAFTIIADLGTDAITSPALVANIFTTKKLGFEFLTVGRALICVHISLVLLQIVLLRSKYNPIQLLQVVMAVILGLMLDVCLSYTALLPVPSYAAKMGYTLLACVVSAFGIFTYVKADMVPLSAEGLCLALSRTFNWKFSRVKVGVDCSMIAISVVASLILLGSVEGVREGSLICACCTGFIIGFFFKIFHIWDKLFAAIGGRKAGDEDDKLA